MGNTIKTGALLAAIVALFGALGAAFGGQQGMVMALLLGGGVSLMSYWFSDRIVLSLYHARELDAQSGGVLYRMVSELTTRASMPMPRVYVIDEAQPNAFATGRSPEHAAVAATSGLLELLSQRELRAVLSHELAHIRHYDTLISTLAAVLAGAIPALANFAMFFGSRRDGDGRGTHPLAGVLLLLLAPLAATLIQLAISRAREFAADAGGAEISADPLALAEALHKIEHYAQQIPLQRAEAHPATAQMMIINPLSGEGMAGLFRTHPSTQERAARLEALARGVVL